MTHIYKRTSRNNKITTFRGDNRNSIAHLISIHINDMRPMVKKITFLNYNK